MSRARKPRVLIVDDDRTQVLLLTAALEKTGRFQTIASDDPREALERALEEEPDAVVTDVEMPEMSGLDLTAQLRAEYPTLPIVVLTGFSAEQAGAAAFEAGATDFVTKPMEPRALIARLDRALALVPTQEILQKAVEQIQVAPRGILGEHPRVEAVRSFVQQVAAVPNVAALILGESGTGKNLVARAIHTASPGAQMRFVEVNCAALPEGLLEAEIFGYEKGAFTDARRAKKGLAEVADGGTLFLDEIGTLSPALQAKLLTFLESRTFRRVGGTEDMSVDVRIVAATNAELADEVQEGRFREDLYYRLNVAQITLPPLREIRKDIGTLARHFLARAAEYFSKPLPELSDEGVRRLEAHRWPGNARELRNVIERALIFSESGELVLDPVLPAAGGADARPEAGAGDAAGVTLPGGVDGRRAGVHLPLGLTLDEVERRYIEVALEENEGRVDETAEQLGVTRKVLWSRRKKHGLL